jgi:molybdopterin converting factor subunit 1
MRKQTVLLFATLKDRIGAARVEIELNDGATVKELKVKLAQQFPSIAGYLPNLLVAVDQAFAFDEDLIPTEAEVALFPPVSGGSDFPTFVKILEGPLDLDELVSRITLPTTGAVCMFTGIVRGSTSRGEAHFTSKLYYEAYTSMAEAKMLEVAREIRERWQAVEGIVIVQRVGHLVPGTPTVLIACSAAHRDTGAFEAARYGIDRLKEIVPVWKKEISPDGEIWVEGNYHPGEGD